MQRHGKGRVAGLEVGPKVTEVQYADNRGTRIAFERCGEPGGEPLLLVTGLGSQMVFWPDGLCEKLHSAGFDVVRFDNRDTGLSQRFTSRRSRNPWIALLGRTEPPPYDGDDMADDGFAVMDALGWPSAHLLGISMGSALVQYMAARCPERVRSVACVSTIVWGNALKMASQLKYGTFLKLSRMRFPDTREGTIDQQVAIIAAMAPQSPPFDDTWAREAVAVAYERGFDGSEQSRHLTALKKTRRKRSRAGLTSLYQDITAPTVIMQGTDDPLIKPSAARAVADRIPGAELVMLDNLGHGVPPHQWDTLVQIVRDNADRNLTRATG
jgi:pimeloyl-ACP methyl ester carboxylesterase